MNTDICPLCGGPNQCGMAAGQTTCWCAAATIPAEVIDRIPVDQRDRSCLCPACAKGIEPDGGDGGEEGTEEANGTEEAEGTELPD